jgi:hypothetical protein
MSKQGVKLAVAALIANPIFNKAFFANKKKTLKASGFPLTSAEMRALQKLTKKDVILRVKLNPPLEVVVPLLPKPPGPSGKKIK